MANRKMSDEVREQLLRIQAEKKARDTLKGLDKNLGMIALDKVQDLHDDKLLPQVRVMGDDSIEYAMEGKWSGVYNPRARQNRWSDEWEGDFAKISFFRIKTEKIWTFRPTGISWVRIKYCPDWVTEQFAARFESRRVLAKSYQGPTKGVQWRQATLVPLTHAFAWMQFMWPEEADLAPRLTKYLTGYTDGWIQRYPGIGAKVRITGHMYNPDINGTEGEVIEVSDGVSFKISGDDIVISTRDFWTVVG